MRTVVLAPKVAYIVTAADLFAYPTNEMGVADVGVRVPFEGKLVATPDAAHLFRYVDSELVAVDGQGRDTTTRAKLGGQIWGFAFSRASRLVGVLSAGNRITVLRAADLRRAHPCPRREVRGRRKGAHVATHLAEDRSEPSVRRCPGPL